MTCGYIYKIVNDINDKIYIGQTQKSLQERFRLHVYDSNKKNADNFPIHKAIRKYGMDKFHIIEVEKCSVAVLNEREQYWIAYYDSYNKGYNATLGGEGNSHICVDEDSICRLYENGESIDKLSRKYNVSSTKIRQILLKHDVNIRTLKESLRLHGLNVYCIDESGNRFDFSSLKSAAEFVLESGLTNSIKYTVVSSGIRNAILTGRKGYGYRWFTDDLEKDYILRQRMRIRNHDSDPTIYVKTKVPCPYCGSLMSKKSTMCCSCRKKYMQSKSNCPDKDVLCNLKKNHSNYQISNMYGVSETTVRKWLKKFDL